MELNPRTKVPAAFVAATSAAILFIPLLHCAALGLHLSSTGSCAATFIGYVGFGSVFAVPATVAFGVPLYLVFRKYGWLSWWQVAGGAGIAGAAAAVAFLLLEDNSNLPYLLGFFSGLGAFAGIVFWLVGVRHQEP